MAAPRTDSGGAGRPRKEETFDEHADSGRRRRRHRLHRRRAAPHILPASPRTGHVRVVPLASGRSRGRIPSGFGRLLRLDLPARGRGRHGGAVRRGVFGRSPRRLHGAGRGLGGAGRTGHRLGRRLPPGGPGHVPGLVRRGAHPAGAVVRSRVRLAGDEPLPHRRRRGWWPIPAVSRPAFCWA